MRHQSGQVFGSFYVSKAPLEKFRGPPKATNGATLLTGKAIFYMFLLAIQFGMQPSLTKRYISKTCNTSSCRSSVVLVQEALKFIICSILLLSDKKPNVQQALQGWSIKVWLAVAGIPSLLYCIQNLSALMAYQVLDPFTFNVLNQTKTLSAALCCYLVMGWKQSRIQIVALFLLLVAALTIEGAVPLTLPTVDKIKSFGQIILSRFTMASTVTSSSYTRHFTQGVLPVLLASFLSGLAGALSQKNLQCNNRNSYLFSMELCAASSIILIASMCLSDDGKTLYQNGFFQNWTWGTVIPIFTNSVGGIVVGLVTKHAGSVQKGFALVFGICLSGIVQALISTDDGSRITQEQVVGGSLAAVSLLMHCMNPYVPSKSASGVPDQQNQQDNVAAAISIKRKSRKED